MSSQKFYLKWLHPIKKQEQHGRYYTQKSTTILRSFLTMKMWPSASVLSTLTSLPSTTVVLTAFVFTALLSTTVAFTTVIFTTVVFTTVASPTVCRRSLASVVQFTVRPLASVVASAGGTLAAVFQAAGL